MEFVFSTVFFIAWPSQCPSGRRRPDEFSKMVVQLVILPVGFGRFFPHWQMASHSDKDRERAIMARWTLIPSCATGS